MGRSFDYCQCKSLSAQTGCLAMGYNGSSLAEAEVEAQRVGQIAGGKSYVDVAATRTALLEAGTNYRYLHLSCHGRFNSTWPMASSLTLADDPLDVADILQNLRLEADLVSLSACETGRSQVMLGDELIGLAISAGFDCLQNVPDEACLLAHPYYWVPFFLVGERLVRFGVTN